MASNLKTTTANKALDAITTDVGTTAYLIVYPSTPPAKTAHAYGAPGQTALVKMPCTNPLGAGASNGVLTLSTITTTAATASGTPGFFRICTSATDTDGSTTIVQGLAAVGSGDLNFSSTIASGGNVSVSSFTVTNGSEA